MDEVKQTRSHRVGSITFGSTLVLFGTLFLLHIIIPALHYELIFQLWPCVFIILGIEVLIANMQKNVEFVYDKWAIVLTVVMILFAMSMAGFDWALQQRNFIYF